MPIIAKDSGGGPREIPEADIHNAVCAFVEDVGVLPGYKNAPPRHKIIIFWELEAKMSDGRPFMLSKKYTLSLFEKAVLRHDLEGWRGKPFTPEELEGFDVEKLRGVPCRLNVTHKAKEGGGTVAVISSIAKPTPGYKQAVTNDSPPDWIQKERANAITEDQGAPPQKDPWD